MPRPFLEDMVKAKRKQEIPKMEVKPSVVPKLKKLKTGEAKGKSKYFLWLVAFVSALFCFFAVSFLFTRAEIVVSPKTQEISLNDNLEALRDSNDNGLAFNLVVIDGSESKTLQAAEQKDVQMPATGTVVIYNTFSSAPQNLAVDTRLEGSNGKIYKTSAKTVVPGMAKSGTPGSVEAKIYASVPGTEYNSGPLDFKIAGFKGTSKYTKFYGRSKGDISGGFIGKAPDVSEADKSVALAAISKSLNDSLIKKITDQIPPGFVLFKSATFLNTGDSDVSSTYNPDGTLTLIQKGTMYGILFNEQKLTEKIAADNIENYDGGDVYIPDIQNLNFSLPNPANVSFDSLQNINFNLSGSAKLVWKLDVNKFTGDLLGKSKKDFNKVLSEYPNINSATLTVSPAWVPSIPGKAKNIKIIVNYPK